MPTLTICDSCLTPVPNLPMTHRGGSPAILCPQCAAREVLGAAASQHLHDLIYPTVLAWAQHWSASGVSLDSLSGALALEGMYWSPSGARYRGPVDEVTSAAAVIQEALA